MNGLLHVGGHCIAHIQEAFIRHVISLRERSTSSTGHDQDSVLTRVANLSSDDYTSTSKHGENVVHDTGARNSDVAYVADDTVQDASTRASSCYFDDGNCHSATWALL